MTYLDTEQSAHGGKPIELYKFEGTYENYYYTSAARRIKYGVDALGNDVWYEPISLQRTEVAAGTENDDGLNITIDLPVTAGLVAIYGFEDAPPQLDLTIFRYHNINEVIPYWIGPVVSITTNDGIATVQSNSELATLLAEDFPNVYYQAPCNFVLFDQRCKVIEANYSGTAHLGAVNGKTISVDAIPAGASAIPLDGKLVGGEVRLSSGERRMIVAQAGVVITLNFAFSRTVANDLVTITAGCDHGYTSDCKLKFDNQKNFGGFPFIGSDNPFTAGIQDGSTLPDNTCLPQVFDGVYYSIVESAPNPCNANWSGNRVITLPPDVGKPNGPNGRDLSNYTYEADGGETALWQLFENNVPGDPRCQGQVLLSFVAGSFNDFTFNVHFPITDTGWHVHIFPAARYCGSVGKDEGRLAIGSQNFGDSFVSHGEQPAGGLYNIDWAW